MTEPKTIEPQDVRPGDRICVAWSTQGVDRTMTLTAAEVDLESMVVKNGDGYWVSLSLAGRATITLVDRPEPERPVGSHWLDPETGAEYVATDEPVYKRYRSVPGGADSALNPYYVRQGNIIARLTPLPAFDPAALWPAADGAACGERAPGRPLECTLAPHRDGLHAAHTDLDEPPVYVWGRP